MKLYRHIVVLTAVVTATVAILLPPMNLSAATGTVHVGAVFPLKGVMSPLARDEYRGVQIARDLVNADGGVGGRPIVLDTRELHSPSQSGPAMASLRAQGDTVVLGAYSSALSIPASVAASRRGMVYWEAGAVADRLTGQGLPGVFRVGASGSNLGANSARFAAFQLAPRLHKRSSAVRVSVVFANDDYARSVAGAAMKEGRRWGLQIVSKSQYDVYAPDWAHILQTVKGAHPDILILASHIPDGVAFRRAMLAAHLHVGAFIGSTMAQCIPEFGALLGRDAIGVFASDRPGEGYNPRSIPPPARALYNRFASAWRAQTGRPYPSEEGLAGFTAAWTLFHYVLVHASHGGTIGAGSVIRSAQSLNLPRGTLPNGAGVRFARDRHHLGQNMRASAVIWQWQGIRHSVVVWPPVYATGRIALVPLPR